MSFAYLAPARSPRAVLLLLGLWALLAYGWLRMDVEDWIVLPILLFTLPLAWEVATGRVSLLEIEADRMRWHSGRLHDSVDLADLDHVRLDRRFDGSVRATLVLTDGRKPRLPQDCLPPHRQFEAALVDHGVKVERHPFSLL